MFSKEIGVYAVSPYTASMMADPITRRMYDSQRADPRIDKPHIYLRVMVVCRNLALLPEYVQRWPAMIPTAISVLKSHSISPEKKLPGKLA